MRTRVAGGLILIIAVVMTACAPAPAAPSAPATKSATTSGDAIKIGLTTALSGPIAASGQQQRMAAQLALEQFNAQGGVNGKNIELIAEDNACNPTEGVNAANKLIAERVAV